MIPYICSSRSQETLFILYDLGNKLESTIFTWNTRQSVLVDYNVVGYFAQLYKVSNSYRQR